MVGLMLQDEAELFLNGACRDQGWQVGAEDPIQNGFRFSPDPHC
jgi:hypothetical protein